MNIVQRVVVAPLRGYAARLNLVFGWRFLAFLGISQGLLKGALLYIVGGVMLPIYKNVLGVDAATMQFFMMLTMVPWSIKPLLGLLSDHVAIGGLHKRPWLLQSMMVGCVGAGFAFLAMTRNSGLGLALCFAGVQLQIALYDLMAEAVFSARMRTHDAQEQDPNKKTGSDVVTLSQNMQMVGGIAATLVVGVMADHGAYTGLLAIAALLCVTPLLPTLWGWLCEERDAEVVYTNRFCCWGVVQFSSAERVTEQQGMILVIAFMGIAAPVTAFIANAGDPAIALAVATLFCVAAIVGAYAVFPRLVAHVALYQVLRNVGSPSISGALDYFYVGDEQCVPGGPHFSFTYYLLVAGLIGYGASLFGGIVYQAYMSKMRFRSVVLVTTILSALTGLSDLFIITRANIALGIPDKLAYVAGEAILEPMIGLMNYIPIAALLSKSAPPGMESSVFSFLAGIGNFSGLMRELSGALLFDVAGVVTVGECNWQALPVLVLTCHVLGPLVTGVAASFLIPNVQQTENVQEVASVDESDREFDGILSTE